MAHSIIDIFSKMTAPSFIGRAGGESFLLILLLFFFSSCYNSPQHIILENPEATTTDSSAMQLSRPYGVGYNLLVHADSLLLVEDRPMHWSEGVAESSDSQWVRQKERIVIAALTVIPEDSIDSVWVKVARDQFTMGWMHETDLLEGTSPDDPISLFIRFFSNSHVLWFLIVMSAVAAIVLLRVMRRQRFRAILFDDIPSIYPTLLTSTLALSALLYAFIQHYHPQMWVQFYYHPTLNPFSQPMLLCLFLCTVWALFLLMLTVVDDVLKLLSPVEALLYLFSLLGVCMVLYLMISLFPILLAATLCLAYILFALYRYLKYARALYLCGRCHKKLQHKGVCPYCGAINE